ncbi:MAG TPA: SDR family NAD(P)-dependent oxidoreductase [Hyphomicrobiaceae bacterium]|nr:SDR family NAD(P)-dependent oxidoreductase [Hyphomicrobiaceae bacterium]
MKAEQLFNVRGLGALVTGAASGIGLAYAEVLAANGANVALLDRDEERLGEAVADVRAIEDAGRVLGEVADVTDAGSLTRAFAATAAALGRIDVVFANAGISGGPGFLTAHGERSAENAIEAMPPERWAGIIDTNLSGVFRTIQAAVPHLKAAGGGRIIVTTSIAAMKIETVIGAAYPVAKAGAAHLVRQVALELARYNIKVNAIAPGPFVTNIAGARGQDPAVRAWHERSVPQKRIASTDEIMGLALLLASPASDYMTGAQIVIDGGATLGTAE